MSEKIVRLNEDVIKGQLKELVRGSAEETLNELLEKEGEQRTQAARYKRSEAQQGYRSGHYDAPQFWIIDGFPICFAVAPVEQINGGKRLNL